MNKGIALLGGLGLGAGLMYFFDPALGRRRRVVARDQLTAATNDLCNGLEATWTDVAHRAEGFVAETAALCSCEHAEDSVIEARVRAKLGHCVSHPGAIHVSVEEGRVCLEGTAYADEQSDLLSAVRSVRGVTHVANCLRDDSANGRHEADWRRHHAAATSWSPATRLLAVAAGGALAACSLTQRFPVACVLGTAGLGLFARGLLNTSVTRIVHAKGRWATHQLQH
jgi:hypothetical protein